MALSHIGICLTIWSQGDTIRRPIGNILSDFTFFGIATHPKSVIPPTDINIGQGYGCRSIWAEPEGLECRIIKGESGLFTRGQVRL